jgi:hypothetical protein
MELAEIKPLKAENRRLREDVKILRGATISSSGNSTAGTADHGQDPMNDKLTLGSQRRLPLLIAAINGSVSLELR